MEWIEADWPAPPWVRALTTTRLGGVSEGAYAGLNLGDHVGDAPDRVAANRAQLRRVLGLPADPRWLRQVHGCEVFAMPSANLAQPCEADAAVAWGPGQVCAVLTADCLPLLLTDRAGTRVAAIHAGWRGLAAGVIEAAVVRLAVPPDALLAWLGPAIGPAAFEVGAEVREVFVAQDRGAAVAFSPCALSPFRGQDPDAQAKSPPTGQDRFTEASRIATVQTPSPQPPPARGEGVRESAVCAAEAPLGCEGSERIPRIQGQRQGDDQPGGANHDLTTGPGPVKWRADLYQLARLRLARLGVSAVWGGGLCTYQDSRRFYSYRRDGVTGRLASLIWIDPGQRLS